MSSQWFRCYVFRPVILCILIIVPLMVPSVVGAQEKTVLSPEIATVTSFVGEVLVRNRMVWTRVEAEGHPLFTGDKVVTKRGRAEVTFADGSKLTLGMDSNSQITERVRQKGLIFRRKWIKRTIRLALGKFYFSLNTVQGKGTVIETPTMVAGIRGTAGLVDVGPDGGTQWGLSQGQAVTDGAYEPLEGIEIPDVSVPVDALPPSDPAYSGTEIMQSVDRALASQLEADLAVLEADQLEQEAAEAEELATLVPTAENRVRVAERRVAANRAKLQSVVTNTQSRRAAVSEAIVEAETMNDPQSAERARGYLERIDIARQEVQKAIAREDGVDQAVPLSPEEVLLVEGRILLSNSEAHTASSFGLVADGLAKAANMEARGDRSDARNAVQFVEVSERMAYQASGLVEEAGEVFVQGVPLGDDVLQAVENTTRAISETAVIQDLGTLDGVAMEAVTALAHLAQQQADLALNSANNALEAARAGDDAALREALGETAETVERMDSIMGNVAGEGGVGEFDVPVVVTEALLDVAREWAEQAGEATAEQQRMQLEQEALAAESQTEMENTQDLLVNEIVEAAAVLNITVDEAAELVLPIELLEDIEQVASPH